MVVVNNNNKYNNLKLKPNL